jgi:predicted O-linked N-acetylglucosamine transferase (SPINDLY family)
MVSGAELTREALGLLEKGELEQAGILYEEALALDPQHFDARNGLGSVRLRQNRIDEAIAELEYALVVNPHSVEALCNLGNALARQARFEEALACYDGALATVPRYWAALNNRGNVLLALSRYQDAISSYDQAIAIEASIPTLYFNRGLARFALQQHEEAVADLTSALARKPDYAEALQARGNALRALRRDEEAAASYLEAASLSCSLQYVLGDALHSKMQVCDWHAYDELREQVFEGVNERQLVCVPFVLFSLTDDPAIQLHGSRSYAHANHPARPVPFAKRSHKANRKIRIAYLSAKFHDHAGSRLIAGLLELHDKSRFETMGISFGPPLQGGMRARLQLSLDQFLDVCHLADEDVAALMRERNVDLAVDLVGYGENGRPGIFALRGAPIQVSFLGYPATMGAEFIDYIIADAVVIPHEEEQYYSEKVVRLPGSYQVNDSRRRIPRSGPSRQTLGLPEHGFVYCCFNYNYKITPAVFDVWMRILQRAEGSVLWLLRGSATAERNLRKEAEQRGVDPDRIVFAPKVSHDDHLARHCRADLFLDTLPCNAHVTASDALWAGLPVLTCMGRGFASRVGASLLHAMEVTELVTESLTEYEDQAVRLASDPAVLRELRERIVRNRTASALFDTDRFRRHLEAAYTRMWEAYQCGQRPKSFEIER